MKIIEFLIKVRKVPSWNRNPAISDEDLENLINQIDMLREEDLKVKYNPCPIIGSSPWFVPSDFSEEDILCTKLAVAMDVETAALKGIITNRRRKESHRFILECFDRLAAASEESGRQKEAPGSDRR